MNRVDRSKPVQFNITIKYKLINNTTELYSVYDIVTDWFYETDREFNNADRTENISETDRTSNKQPHQTMFSANYINSESRLQTLIWETITHFNLFGLKYYIIFAPDRLHCTDLHHFTYNSTARVIRSPFFKDLVGPLGPEGHSWF